MIGENIPEVYRQLPPAICACGEIGLLLVAYLNPGILARCPHCERLLIYDSKRDKVDFYIPEAKLEELIKASEN